MKFYKLHVLLLTGAFCFLSFISESSAQEILDEITLKTNKDNSVDIEVRFIFQIQYLRRDPDSKSSFAAIYFRVLGNLPPDTWRDYQTVRTPPVGKVNESIVRDVTITTKDLATGPKVLINLFRPSDVNVTLGSKGQSLLIHIVPESSKDKKVSGPAESIVPAPPISPPAAVDVLPPSQATLTKPSLPTKRIHIPLGGKDGLPPFPDIDEVAQIQKDISPEENLSLEERIKRTEAQASPLMVQGGNAILAGQPFLAVESFNKVLTLSPNKYSQHAQLWVGIARERIGQQTKAIIEYQTYLKLYPQGEAVKWVNDRMAVLKKSFPEVFAKLAGPESGPAAPVKIQQTEFKAMEYGSLAMYAYTGASKVTTATVPPTVVSRTDQRSVITNINLTGRYFNNEYDNRLVFQDFYAANFLSGQDNNNRLGAFFYEIRDRVVNYYARIGRQSGMGGGVLGRFDGISAGYGITSNYSVNIVSGKLADISADATPTFKGASVDFGIVSPVGGSLYFISQSFQGIVDRRAVGGNLRYFDQDKTILSLFDYDTQIRGLNILTLQGSTNSQGKGNDYNFILDHRKNPLLDIRNAVSGTTATINGLIQNGWTIQDLSDLAKQRTATSNMAQFGLVKHVNEKWNAGTDVSVSNTGGLSASGTLLPDGSTGIEGYVPPVASSGNALSLSQRFTGSGVFRSNDITTYALTYSKSRTNHAQSFQFNNHVDLQEKWALDTSIVMSLLNDVTSQKVNTVSPTLKVTYRIKNNLSEDTQLGINRTQIVREFSPTTTTIQYFFSTGFQWNF
jgi:hypothetical protein